MITNCDKIKVAQLPSVVGVSGSATY